jgi:hypothetical protein
MPRDGSGNYTRPVNAVDPAVPITTIDSTAFNQLTLDLATEMTDSLDRSGKGAMLAGLGMGGFKITNLGVPAAASDAARLDNVTGITLAGDVTGSTGTNVVANVPGGKVTGLAAGAFATAGKVGQIFTASNVIALSNGVPARVTKVDLTAGNWLLFAEYNLGPSATWTAITVVISTVDADITAGNSVGNAYSVMAMPSTTFTSTASFGAVVGIAVVSIAAPASYYLNANAAFATGMNIGGVLTAVRLG